MADYEHGITREFSVHGGIRNRFLTWNAEFGARYAVIKSSRTQTLLTGILDFRMARSVSHTLIIQFTLFKERAPVSGNAITVQ